MNGEDRRGNHHRQSRTVAIFRFHTFILSHLRTRPQGDLAPMLYNEIL